MVERRLVVLVLVGFGAGCIGGLVPGCGESGSAAEAVDAGPDVADSESAAEILEAVTELRADQEYGRAEAILASAVRTYPDDQGLRLVYAEVLLNQEKFDQAYRQYERAIEIGPETAAVRFAAGTAASVLDRDEAAAGHFERAVTLAPGQAEYAVHRARALVDLNEIEAAKAELVRAATLDEQRAVVWGLLGELALRENDARMAAQHAAKARSIEPAIGAWRVIEARALKRLGEPEAALLVLDGIKGSERTTGPVARAEAECFGLLGRPGDGAARLAAAARAHPQDGALWFEAAVWAQRAGDADQARRHARTASMLGHEGAGAFLEGLKER